MELDHNIVNDDGITHIDLLSDLHEDAIVATTKKKKSFSEDFKKHLTPKNVCIVLGALVIAILLFAVRAFLDNIILNQNNQTVRELAIHDEHSLVNYFENEWSRLELIPLELKGMGAKSDSSLLTDLQLISQADSVATTYVVTAKGDCYLSNGVKAKDDKIMQILAENSEKFVVLSDEYDAKLVENRKEYIIFGVKTAGVKVGDESIIAVLRKVEIDSLDNVFNLESFDGKGLSGIINSDGAYIVSTHRTSSFHTRENEDDILSKAYNSKYDDFAAVKAALKDDKGIVFTYIYDNVEYYEYVQKIKNTNWYYYLRVPNSVFRDQTTRILVIFIGMVIVIISLVLAFAIGIIIGTVKKAKREKLYNEEMSKALVAAENANKAKTRFLSTVSHDIRTPMNAILGYAELASMHLSEPKVIKEYIDKTVDTSNQLQELINSILDMSRIESGRITLIETKENVESIINGVVNMNIEEINRKNQTLTVNLSTVINKNVICDKFRVSQILTNIVSNAIKYTNDGGEIDIKVRELYSKKEGKHLFEFVIKDNGIGMSRDFVSTVFEPFSKESSVVASEMQGTGLGMAISKMLVDLMGGRITCSSEPNKGTEFAFMIPLETYENDEIDLLSSGMKDISFSGKKVLLAENDTQGQKILAESLRDRGFIVEIAPNGKIACNMIIEKGYYDLVIMDVNMPERNGYEAAKIIRSLENEKIRNVPIIAVVEYEFADAKRQVLEAGMNAHIAKPVKASVLMNVIKNLL